MHPSISTFNARQNESIIGGDGEDEKEKEEEEEEAQAACQTGILRNHEQKQTPDIIRSRSSGSSGSDYSASTRLRERK